MDQPNPFSRLTARSVFLWMIASLFLYGLIAGAAGENPKDPAAGLRAQVWLYGLLLVWVSWVFARLGIDGDRIIGRPPGRTLWPLLLSLLVLLTLFRIGAFWLVYYPLSFLAPETVEPLLKERMLAGGARGASDLLLKAGTVVLAGVLAPVAEELVYRVILLHRWTVKWGIRAAVLLSSLAYALMHYDPLGAFVFGFALAALYIRTGSLAVPVLLHALSNLVSLGLEAAGGPPGPSPLTEFRAQAWIGALCLAVSLPGVLVFLRRNWPQSDWRPPYFAEEGPGAAP